VSWVPAEQVLATVGNQRQVLAAEEARVSSFTQYHATERAKLEAEGTAALHDLGNAVLPRLDHASIGAAAQAFGLVGLPNENIPAQLESRRGWLVSRLQAILHDPRYAQRELLRHPRTGSLTTAIAQNEEHRRPFAEIIAMCEQHPRFERLWGSGFGMPEHSASWWRYSYWQDRSAADELVTKFQGKTSFAEVRAEYARAKETVLVFDGELRSLRAQIADGEALDREYATLYEEHRTLDARGLEHTRSRIVQHLLGSDAAAVSQRLRSSPATSNLLLLFLRASGIAAKVSYLDGIQQTNLGEIRKDIALQRERLDGVETRTRRRWAPMPLDKFQKLAEDRRPRYEKRWQRFGKTYNTVYVYDRYDRGRYYEDFLWWDLFTRGRYDGSYLPEVHHYHQSHPGYAFDPDWKTRAAEQRAAESEHDHDHGDVGPNDIGDVGPNDIGDVESEAAAAAAFADSADDNGDTSGDTTTTDAS